MDKIGYIQDFTATTEEYEDVFVTTDGRPIQNVATIVEDGDDVSIIDDEYRSLCVWGGGDMTTSCLGL